MARGNASIENLAAVAALSLLVLGCFVVLRPFLAAILWALILASAAWPGYRWLKERVGGRRTLAAAVMTLTLASILLVPLVILGASLADDVGRFAARARELFAAGPPAIPVWVPRIPLVGPQLEELWNRLFAGGASAADLFKQYIVPIRSWLVATGASVGQGVLDLSLSVFTAFFIFRDGEAGARNLRAVLERLSGDRAQRLLDVTERTMTGVVYGILGTAIAQGSLAAIGLSIAGVPGALFLGVVTTLLSVVPVGPPLVWGSAAAWLFYNGEIGWGIFMLAWGLGVISSVDNFLKPYFISRGSNLPLILVFLGVFGGILAFGFLGIFLGPTLLALGYTLLREWSHSEAVAQPGPSEGQSA